MCGTYLSLGVDHVLAVVEELQLDLVELLLVHFAALGVLQVLRMELTVPRLSLRWFGQGSDDTRESNTLLFCCLLMQGGRSMVHSGACRDLGLGLGLA